MSFKPGPGWVIYQTSLSPSQFANVTLLLVRHSGLCFRLVQIVLIISLFPG